MSKVPTKKEVVVKHSIILATYLIIVWGFYRFLFKLPDEVEELMIKPLVWLTPVYWFSKKEKLSLASLGVTTNNLFPSIYKSLWLGVIFVLAGILANSIKYGGINFSANVGEDIIFVSFLLSLVTAISEEITFRGYLFNRLWQVLDNEFAASLSTSFVWGLIHLPAGIFWLDLTNVELLAFFVLTTLFGLGSCFIFARTKNIFASVLIHVFWAWPIFLFR